MGERRQAVGDVGAVDPAFWAGRRVLVTGSTGFKGSWLCLWLLELGAQVSGLALAPESEPSLFTLAGLERQVDQRIADVRDANAVAAAVAAARPEVVIHMAAQPFVRRSLRDPLTTYATNVMGTAHLLDAVRRAPAATRVVVSVTSDKCYENREREHGYSEDEPLGGRDPYSSSKACAELVTAAYRDSYFTDAGGPRIASARAGNVIGGGDYGEDRLVPDLVRGALAGMPVAVRRPDAVRPWQHVLNPLSGYLLLAQALWADGAHATAYNFGPAGEDARPVADLVERFAARWPGGISCELDPGPHPHEATVLRLDSSRARTRLGWRPLWDLGAAIDATVDWHVRVRGGEEATAVTRGQVAAYTAAGRVSRDR